MIKLLFKTTLIFIVIAIIATIFTHIVYAHPDSVRNATYAVLGLAIFSIIYIILRDIQRDKDLEKKIKEK
jgi:amino acid permease